MNNDPYTNKLIHETSPYLLQHAHHPVDWYPWGEKALEKAREENKLLIISIGYAACHWCHVMAHACFEDTTVAHIMNDHFVCIKVDREERPDIDQIYMNAAYLTTGNGGWPLNAFALPDGRPIYAGTYYPKNNWIEVLNYFIDMRQNQPNLLTEQADKVIQGIQTGENIVLSTDSSAMTITDLNQIFDRIKPNLDFENGGENRAPKFPMPSIWEYLMYYFSVSHHPDALKAVTITLDRMAFGGIYDQIGGGFARYSVDKEWHVPHFEKMLYDNGQLVSLYTHAWQLTKNDLYKQIVYKTLDFIEHEMISPEGGFYSSFDADSEGEEGKYYVWTIDEVNSILGDDAALFSDYYNITASGNWENGNNILLRKKTDEKIAKKSNLSVVRLRDKIEFCKNRLKKIRSNRTRPQLDDKILTSWNAMMLNGFIQAYRAFGEEKFLKIALDNAAFLMKYTMNKENEINRNYKNGKSSIPGLLDDYAFTIAAYIQLYQATFDEKWLNTAKTLCDTTILHFYDAKSGMFYYTHNNYSNLVARKMEIADNVIPSSNSEMAMNLYLLGQYFADEVYVQKSEQMLRNIQDNMQQHIYYYANWGKLAIHIVNKPYEVAIVGNDCLSVRAAFDQNYLPSALFFGGREEGTLSLLENRLVDGKTTIYVCRDKTCKLPVTDVKLALEQIYEQFLFE